MKRPGILFVISGPSGSGKTTLCRGLLEKHANLLRSVSVTTRNPRKGEQRGNDYIYVNAERFKALLQEKAFIEHAVVCGSRYGTPRSFVEKAIKQGKDIILNIDVQGGRSIKRLFGRQAVLIFIMPPSASVLEKRLMGRSSDNISDIRNRLKVARNEMRAAKTYDYLVINDSIQKAVNEISAIVSAERLRVNKNTTT